jgi:RimJ/RimL family protein N-acetyltransferase
MFHELQPDAFPLARRAFEPMAYNLAVNSIIEGATPSRIFVDDPESPQAAITWNKARAYLSGNSTDWEFNEGLHDFFQNHLFPEIRATGGEFAILYYAPKNWEEAAQHLFEGNTIHRHLRHFYQIDSAPPDWRSRLPATYELLPIDHSLLSRTTLKNMDSLVEEMQSESPSPAAFLERCFGFCALRGEELVGWCLSEYNSADRCEVGIEVIEKYQRKGIGTALASALIEKATGLGMAVGWHCYAGNAPSVELAIRLGFEKIAEYPVFIAELTNN